MCNIKLYKRNRLTFDYTKSLSNSYTRIEMKKSEVNGRNFTTLSAFLSSSLFPFNYAITPSTCSFRALSDLLAKASRL